MTRLVIAVCAAALLAASAQAQTKGKVHRMEINNGITQSVRYFGTGLTPAESSTLRDLERLENETYFARNLISLKKEYVATENVLEPQRRQIQYQAIGADLTYLNYPFVYGYGLGNAAYGRGWAFPGLTYANWGPALAPSVGVTTALNTSMYNNVGMDSPIRDALAKTVAQQATPEYVASLERSFERAMLRASASPTLRAALDLPSPADARQEQGAIRAVAGEENGGIQAKQVTLLLKGGDKVVGKSMTERDGWMIVELNNGGRTRVRSAEVVRIDEGAAGGGIKPAAGGGN